MTVTTNYLTNILGHDADAMLALRELPAFRGCPGSLLELVFRYGKVVLLQEGEELTREGEFDQWVFFIVKGRLAVFVGEQRVDTISSSLVGERCILGEHRRATLRATEEGVTALAVDMALLDALREPTSTVREPVANYIELLSIITGEVVNRIVELEFNLIDFSYKYVAHNRTERISEILRELCDNAYRGDRNANFAVYRHLLRRDPVALSRCREADGFTVNTGLLYAEAVLAGNYPQLYGVAEAVLTQRELEQGAGSGNGSVESDRCNFAAFVALVAELIVERLGARQWEHAKAHPLAAGIRKHLALRESLAVDLRGLMEWLTADYRFTAEDTIDLLMTVLKEASDFTARINGSIKAMVNELTQTRFAKELESAALHKAGSVAEYYKYTPLEELIPFFSQNILQVYLVQPYAERLHAAQTGSWEHREGAAGRAEMLTELFD